MFARNSAGLNLSPAERAFLKLLKTVLFGAAALVAVNLGPISLWVHSLGLPPSVADAAMVLLTAIIASYDKYSSAKGDAPLPPKQVQIQQTPAGLTVSAEAPQPAPSAL